MQIKFRVLEYLEHLEFWRLTVIYEINNRHGKKNKNTDALLCYVTVTNIMYNIFEIPSC